MYNTILFDLDGTLTDSQYGIINSIVYALKKFGIEVEDRSQLKKFLGPPLHESFANFYGFSEEKALIGIDYYREYFHDKGIFENEVYEGVYELLDKIKASGRKIILATSKPEEYAVRILEHFDLTKYFDVIAGATMDGTRSKKTDVIEYALQKGKVVNFEETIMVGDREHDILGSKKFGLDSIGVLYGYGNLDELNEAGATYIAETVEDILEYL